MIEEVREKKSGNNLYIASRWSETHDLVKHVLIRGSSFTNNPVCNFVSDYLCLKNDDPGVLAIGLKSSGDDICPVIVNGTYTGANHSWSNLSYVVTMTAHGKTVADIGAIYENSSGVEFVILRIVDVDKFWIISKNKSVDYTYSFVEPIGVLTYLSNGNNTSDIVVSSSIKLDNMHPCVAAVSLKVMLNGQMELVNDGDYSWNFLDIQEVYDVLDLPSIIDQLITNRPVGGYLTAPLFNSFADTEPLFNHAINYRFTANGNTVVTTTIRAYKEMVLNSHGFIQAQPLTTGNLYIPKTKPISGYDFTQITNWSVNPVSTLGFTSTYWEYINNAPDRVINQNSNVSIQYGYITDRGYEGSVSNALTLYNATRKIYPLAITNKLMQADTSFSCVAFRSYTNPANNPIGRTNYTYVKVGNVTFLYLDYHGTLNDFIEPNPDWVGKEIIVYEGNHNCELIANIATGAIMIKSTATSTDYGYIVLKIS